MFQYMRKYNAESPKQGSKRFNSIVKTKYIDDLGIVYLCLQGLEGEWRRSHFLEVVRSFCYFAIFKANLS